MSLISLTHCAGSSGGTTAAVVVVLMLLLCAAVVAFLYWRHRQKQAQKKKAEITPQVRKISFVRRAGKLLVHVHFAL